MENIINNIKTKKTTDTIYFCEVLTYDSDYQLHTVDTNLMEFDSITIATTSQGISGGAGLKEYKRQKQFTEFLTKENFKSCLDFINPDSGNLITLWFRESNLEEKDQLVLSNERKTFKGSYLHKIKTTQCCALSYLNLGDNLSTYDLSLFKTIKHHNEDNDRGRVLLTLTEVGEDKYKTILTEYRFKELHTFKQGGEDLILWYTIVPKEDPKY